MSLIPAPIPPPKESALLVLLFSPSWSRVVPLHSWVLLEVPPPPTPDRGYLPVLGIQIIQKPDQLESRSCCLPDKIVIEKKYNKCKLSIDHSHLLGKIKGLQTNEVISNNQHNYKKMKCPGLRSEHINVYVRLKSHKNFTCEWMNA